MTVFHLRIGCLAALVILLVQALAACNGEIPSSPREASPSESPATPSGETSPPESPAAPSGETSPPESPAAPSGEAQSEAYIKSVELVEGSPLVAMTIHNSEVENDLYLECTFQDNLRGGADTKRYEPFHIDKKSEQLFEFPPAAFFPGKYESTCDLKEEGRLFDATHDEDYQFTIDLKHTHLANPNTFEIETCGPSRADRIVMTSRIKGNPRSSTGTHFAAEFFIWNSDDGDKPTYAYDGYREGGGPPHTLGSVADIKPMEPGNYVLDCVLVKRLNAIGKPPNYLDSFDPILFTMHAVEVVASIVNAPSIAFIMWEYADALNKDFVQQIYTTTFTVNEDLSIAYTVPEDTLDCPEPTPPTTTAAPPAADSQAGDLLWRYETGGGVSSSPTLTGGVVYVGSSDGYLYALDAACGDLLWKYRMTSLHGGVFSSPTVSDGIVYVGSGDGYLYALDAATGGLLWRDNPAFSTQSSPTVSNGVVYVGSGAMDAATGSPIWGYETTKGFLSSPTVVGGVVYVGSGDNHLYALDAASGDLLWRYETGKWVNSSPMVSDGVVYVGSYDGHLYALDTASGDLLWRYETGLWVASSPTVAGGVVYVGSSDDHLYALDAATGDLEWRYKTRNEVRSSPTVVDDVVYVGSKDNHLYALDAASGDLLWRYETGGQVSSSPMVSDGVAYVGSNDHHLYAVKTGTHKGAVPAATATQPPRPPQRQPAILRQSDLLWRYQFGDDVESPTVAGGMAYAGSDDGYLYALDAVTGDLLWQYETGEWVHSSPMVSDGVVYVSSYDSFLYALDTASGDLLWRYQTVYGLYSPPTVAGGVVYASSGLGFMSALNAATGDLLWRYRHGVKPVHPSSLTLEAYYYYSPFTVAGGVVYVGLGDAHLYALNGATGGLLWRHDTGGKPSSIRASDGVVYVGSDAGHLYALNAATGDLLWRRDTGDEPSSIRVSDGVVYVVSDAGHLYALNAATGDLLWRRDTKGEPSSIRVSDGMVYVGSSGTPFYALDAATGDPLWQHDTRGERYSSLTVPEGVVYVGSSENALYALDAATGDPLWRYEAGGAWSGHTSPTVAGGVVYIGFDDHLYAVETLRFSLATVETPPSRSIAPVQVTTRLPGTPGEPAWSYDAGDVETDPDYGWPPVVEDGVLYVASEGSPIHGSPGRYFYALDAYSGALIWRSRLDVSNFIPVVKNDIVYIYDRDHDVSALDASTGRILWSHDSHDYGGIAVVDNMVFIPESNPNGYTALESLSGEELWVHETGDYIGIRPMVAGGIFYGGVRDKSVFALDQFSGELLWSYEVDLTSHPHSSISEWPPMLYNQTLFLASEDGYVDALDASTGEMRWRYPTNIHYNFPTLANGRVYIAANSGPESEAGDSIVALDASSGDVLWRRVFESGDSFNLDFVGQIFRDPYRIFDVEVDFPPVADSGIIYYRFRQYLHAMDAADGRLLWKFQTTDLEGIAPVVRDGVAYVVSHDPEGSYGTLYALDAASGESLWSYTTDWKIGLSPVVADNLAYVISNDGYVHAISTGR